MKELNTLVKSFKDYTTKEMFSILLYPLVGSLIVMYISFFTIADLGLDKLEQTHIEIQQHQIKVENGEIIESEVNESYTGSSILDFLLKYTATSWIVSFLVYTIGIFAIGYISIFVSLIIIGFLTPRILAIVHKRHYPNLPIDSNFSVFDSILKLIKTIVMMLAIFLILIPFYFIPIVNIIAINLPFYYFFHKMLHFDVGSTLCSKEEFIKIYYGDRLGMRGRTIALYTISLVPFVAFFISTFYIIYLGHVYFKSLQENSEVSS